MKIKWKSKDKLNPQVILDKINSIKSVSKDGKVSYSAFDYHDAFAALFSMLDFPEKITNELNTDSIVSKGLNDAAKSGILTKQSVIESINDVAKSELATREYKYHLLTSLSISGDLPFKRINFESTNIRFVGKEYPKKYESRSYTIESINRDFAIEHDGYSKVIVTVKAKSIYGAASRALRSLDLIRAILSLFSNSGMELFGDQFAPINKIRAGEVHTLHRENGSSVTKLVWFEPTFVKAKVYNPPQIDVLTKNFRWFIERLEQCGYKNVLKEALLRYVRALDEKDHNSALIRLWGALESIAAPSEARYDSIIKRCSFIFKEALYHKQILEHLREYRNKSIHAGDQSERAKTFCFQMQYYFRELILFHLKNVDEFNTIEQANQFLDLPTDPDTILERNRLIKKAIKFRKLDA